MGVSQASNLPQAEATTRLAKRGLTRVEKITANVLKSRVRIPPSGMNISQTYNW